MPTMAITGRGRFWGFSAASVAALSGSPIAGGSAAAVPGGKDSSHAAPAASATAAIPSAIHAGRRRFSRFSGFGRFHRFIVVVSSLA